MRIPLAQLPKDLTTQDFASGQNSPIVNIFSKLLLMMIYDKERGVYALPTPLFTFLLSLFLLFMIKRERDVYVFPTSLFTLFFVSSLFFSFMIKREAFIYASPTPLFTFLRLSLSLFSLLYTKFFRNILLAGMPHHKTSRILWVWNAFSLFRRKIYVVNADFPV